MGTYAVVDTMLKQMKAKGELNLLAYLAHLKLQGVKSLVQTEQQYVFIHDLLAEAVATGETNIHRSYLTRYINSLQSSFTTDENSIPWQLLDRQFKLATAYQPQESQFIAALLPSNQCRNRNFDYLPTETARVTVSSCKKSDVEGSDYINASWMPGFNRLNEFIITQHPMEQTVLDFWQMIWDLRVRTVVVLSPVQQPVTKMEPSCLSSRTSFHSCFLFRNLESFGPIKTLTSNCQRLLSASVRRARATVSKSGTSR